MTQASGREGIKKDMGIIPTTIQMILSAMSKGKPYILGTVGLDNVTLVAKVMEFNEKSGHIEILLQDDTGRIEAKIFKKSGSNVVKPSINYDPRLHEYASIIGSIMNFNNTDIIVINRIKNIQDYSFVYMHRVQILWAHLIRKGLLHATSNDSILNNLTNKFSEPEPADNYNGLHEDQKKVMKFISDNGKDTGIPKDAICKGSGFSADKTNAILAELIEYGFLYTDSECDLHYIT
jgi:hypothetical protein